MRPMIRGGYSPLDHGMQPDAAQLSWSHNRGRIAWRARKSNENSWESGSNDMLIYA